MGDCQHVVFNYFGSCNKLWKSVNLQEHKLSTALVSYKNCWEQWAVTDGAGHLDCSMHSWDGNLPFGQMKTYNKAKSHIFFGKCLKQLHVSVYLLILFYISLFISPSCKPAYTMSTIKWGAPVKLEIASMVCRKSYAYGT